jgi:hypothetical protein
MLALFATLIAGPAEDRVVDARAQAIAQVRTRGVDREQRCPMQGIARKDFAEGRERRRTTGGD